MLSSTVTAAQIARADEQIALGDQALSAGNAHLAQGYYSQSLELDSTRPEAALKLGRANEAEGNYAAAEKAYERAMAIAPTSPTPWIERGALRALQTHYAAALADYSRAIELDKTVARAWYNRGVAHESLKQTQAAIDDYSAAIALQPDVTPLLARARLTESSQREAALSDYQTVLSLEPSPADVQLANERIRALAPKGVPVVARGPRVFVQYSSAQDLARVNELRNTLSSALKPATVAAAEQATSGVAGTVRYFFASDEALANKVLSSTQLALAKQGVRVELKLMRLDSKNFGAASAGTVELWLPSLTTPQPSRPNFTQRPLLPMNDRKDLTPY